MSVKTEPPKNYGGIPPPPPPYTYPPKMEDPDRIPPSLPPMSSLLRHDQSEQEAQPQPYVARQFLPPYNMTKDHPIWLAQADPNAPVHHIYHPPQNRQMNSQFPQAPPQSMLVALEPQRHLAIPSTHSVATQRRTHKRIVQRSKTQEKFQDQGRRDSSGSEHTIHSQPQDQRRESQPRISYEPSFQKRDSAPNDMPSGAMSGPSQSSSTRSMPISGLLSDGPTPAPRPSPKYTLRMRQQPIAARACGFGERDRRVIDPPPILQMHVEDPNSSPEEIRALIRQPYAVVHCVLWDPVADSDDTAMPSTTEKRQQRRLMGTLVASPFVGNDEHGVEGCFFTFPDLSVRTPGTYSLKFSLINLDPTRMLPGSREPIRSMVKSSVFQVFNAKDFRGMRASTELTKTLKHQGCLISVKKGNTKASGSGRVREESDGEDEEDEDDDEDGGSNKKGAKRAKR